VTDTFGDADVGSAAEHRDRAARDLDSFASSIAMRAGTGDRIDHDTDFCI
jgi:hypothetical protein